MNKSPPATNNPRDNNLTSDSEEENKLNNKHMKRIFLVVRNSYNGVCCRYRKRYCYGACRGDSGCMIETLSA